MREALHQLTLTLALPIAVGAVWIARAERAEPPALERATAYRIELADLPLPIRERLRTPGLESLVPVAGRESEADAPARTRPALEGQPRTAARPPVDFEVRAPAKRDFMPAPSPRAAYEMIDTLPRSPGPAVRAVPPLALATPSLSSAPASTLPKSAVPAPSGTGKPAVDDAERIAWKFDRLKERRDLFAPGPKPSPIAKPPARPKIHPVSIPRLAKADGNVPLIPRGPIEKRADDFSFPREPQPPSILNVETPLPIFAAKPEPSFDPEPGISEKTPIVSIWRPRLLVLIPEPGSALLFGAALAALGVLRRSRLRV